jgi:DNA modification methylase
VNIRDRIKELRRVPANELRPNPNNWRTHPEKQLNAIRGVLAEVGFAGAELARELEDGTLELIDGHARAEVAGTAEVPVLVLDVDEAEANKILATFDPIGAMAESDAGKLDAVLRDVDTGSEALQEMLAELADNAGLYRDENGVTNDEPPELPTDPVTNPGDLWILGRHRLLCGNATSRSDVRRLANKKQADLFLTDPPYNVALGMDETPEEAKKRNRRTDGKTIQNDKMDDAEFFSFLKSSFENAFELISPGGASYIFHASTEVVNFSTAFSDAGFLLKQHLVWVKNALVMGRQDYNWQHEPCLYGWKPGAAHRWYGEFDKSTVIDDDLDLKSLSKPDLINIINKFRNGNFSTVVRNPKPAANLDHPTMKPVALLAFLLKNSTNENDVVLDLFSGSGSTMSACEQTKRDSLLLELSPEYCDVIVERWQNLTGEKAKRENGTA